jgi:hypothetical protein
VRVDRRDLPSDDRIVRQFKQREREHEKNR